MVPVALPALVVTVMLLAPDVEMLGTVTVRTVAELTVVDAATPPTVQVVPAMKFAPLTYIVVPVMPEVGETLA